MPDRHGRAFWPGAKGCVSCTYTVSHGVAPGLATLELPDQDVRDIRPFGDLTITDGVGTVVLKKCRVASIDFSRDAGPRRVVLHIADRRWQWQYGYITGYWNQIDPYPDPDLFPPGEFVTPGGPYAPGTFRPAHLLMADCFKAMNEADPFINPAPAVPIPVKWDEEVPASALDRLAHAVGFRVCFRPASDRVLVAPAGVGGPLPSDLPILSESPGVSLPQRPATIQLVGGENVYTDMLKLEPCGEEPDGVIKHIDDLSYRPANGWGTCNTQSFWEVRATNQVTREEARELARRCVWRMFRVAMRDVVTGRLGPNVPGYGRVRDRKQIVLLGERSGFFNRVNGQPMTEPAAVYGSIYAPANEMRLFGNQQLVLGNTDEFSGEKLPRTPSIDSTRGVVTFDRQCWRKAEGAGVEAPVLYLLTSFKIRAVVGMMPTKFLAGGTLAGLIDLNCPPEVLRHPELVLHWSTTRRAADRTVSKVINNLRHLRESADYYLGRANARHEVALATSRTYAGIFPVEPDGAVTQVTWRVGGGSPATTTASLNSEHDPYTPPYPERRWRPILQAIDRKQAKEDLAAGAGYPRTTVSQAPRAGA